MSFVNVVKFLLITEYVRIVLSRYENMNFDKHVKQQH